MPTATEFVHRWRTQALITFLSFGLGTSKWDFQNNAGREHGRRPCCTPLNVQRHYNADVRSEVVTAGNIDVARQIYDIIRFDLGAELAYLPAQVKVQFVRVGSGDKARELTQILRFEKHTPAPAL